MKNLHYLYYTYIVFISLFLFACSKNSSVNEIPESPKYEFQEKYQYIQKEGKSFSLIRENAKVSEIFLLNNEPARTL